MVVLLPIEINITNSPDEITYYNVVLREKCVSDFFL